MQPGSFEGLAKHTSDKAAPPTPLPLEYGIFIGSTT